MLEGVAVLAVALLAVVLVLAKARERLAAPGARRSRPGDDDGQPGSDGDA